MNKALLSCNNCCQGTFEQGLFIVAARFTVYHATNKRYTNIQYAKNSEVIEDDIVDKIGIKAPIIFAEKASCDISRQK